MTKRQRTTSLIVALIGVAVVDCSQAQLAIPPAQLTVPPVQRRRHTGRIIRSFTEPHRQSIVAGAVTGIVVDVIAKEGQRVQVGDPLVKLNRRVLEAQLEIARARATSTARIDAGRSQYLLVKSQLESLQALKQGGHTNRYELEQKQSEFQQALAEFQAAQDEQKLAQLEVKRFEAELEDRTVRSPIAGFITEIHKQPGEQLSNTEPQYATIVSLDKLRVRFYVTADLLKQVQPGDPVVVDVGQTRQSVSGVVNYVSPTIDSDSGVGRLEVLIDNASLSIQSGVVAYWNDIATQELARRMMMNNLVRRPAFGTMGTARLGTATVRPVSLNIPRRMPQSRRFQTPASASVGRARLTPRTK